MNDEGQCVHFFFIYKNIQFHQRGTLIAFHLIIEGSVTSGTGFQRIKEIINDLIQRKGVLQECTGSLHIFHSLINTTALLTKIHNGSDVFTGHHDLCRYHRLLHIFDLRRIRKVGGIGQFDHIPVGLVHFIDYAGCCRHDIQVVFSLQTFLDDLQMQKSQKTTAETKAQG